MKRAIISIVAPALALMVGGCSPNQVRNSAGKVSGAGEAASARNLRMCVTPSGNDYEVYKNAAGQYVPIDPSVFSGKTVNCNKVYAEVAGSTFPTINAKLDGGIIYSGELVFTDNQGHWRPNGHGVYKWPNGQELDADMIVGGKIHGTETMPNGSKYIGSFENGERSGHGVLTLPSGAKFTGQWKDGALYGHGTEALPDGRTYSGQWKDDLPDGHGIETFPDGKHYVGQFVNGQIEGHGVMTKSDGERYDGQWKNGSPDGHGIEVFKNGIFEGELRNGDQIAGAFTDNDGTWVNGTWSNEYRGTIRYPDGRVYIGEWSDDQKAIGKKSLPGMWDLEYPNGNGEMTYPDGRVQQGQWVAGVFKGSTKKLFNDNDGTLNVTSSIKDAEISVDGAYVGNSPAKLKLSSGTYTITVSESGYKSYERKVRIADGAILTLRAKLDKASGTENTAKSVLGAPPNESSIKQLMAITEMESSIQRVRAIFSSIVKKAIQRTIQQAMKGEAPTAKQQQAITHYEKGVAALMQEDITWKKLEPVYVHLYEETFSQKEITDMLAFYKTPTGQAVIHKKPVLLQRSIVEVEKNLSDLDPKVKKLAEQFQAEMAAASK